jgi:outer membrane protein OmpA-like peptidoglycan-associated protein
MFDALRVVGKTFQRRLYAMKKLLLSLLVVALALPACTTPGKKTAYGAGIGAAAGAGVGALIGSKSGHAGKGALIGAAAGALLGGTIGNRLDKQAKELAAAGAETRRTEEGILVNMKSDILFDTGRAILKPAAVEQINQVGDILVKYADDRITVIGHTDSTGSATTNQTLSEQRAQAVKTQLLTRGVPAASISTVGMGASQPIAANTTVAGRSQNRRVELKITIPEAAE